MLSQLTPGGMAQGITKVPAETADKLFLSSEKDSHAIVREPRCRIPPDPWKDGKFSFSLH